MPESGAIRGMVDDHRPQPLEELGTQRIAQGDGRGPAGHALTGPDSGSDRRDEGVEGLAEEGTDGSSGSAAPDRLAARPGRMEAPGDRRPLGSPVRHGTVTLALCA